MSVVAVDTNLALLNEFRESLKKTPDLGIRIAHWTAGSKTTPPEVRDCRAAVLRYVLQHNHKPVQILSSLKKALPSGALVFIIEEDDGLYSFEPPFPAFEELIRVWKKWARAYDADRLIGRKVPRMVTRAGLELVDLQVINHTPYRHGIDLFLEYFRLSFGVVSATTPKVLGASGAKALDRAFRQYAKKFGKDCFLYYPQVVTVARIP